MSRVAFIILSVTVISIIFWSQTACRASGGSNSSDGQQTRTPTSSTSATGEFVDREFRNRRGERMLYRLFVPANYDGRRSYPLALWLHGSGARGDDLRLLAGGDCARNGVRQSAKKRKETDNTAACPVDMRI